MQLLGCLFMLLFGAAIMVLLPFLRMGQILFGLNRSAEAQRESATRQKQETKQPEGGGGKIFQPGEGEYVDFEEVKD